MKTERKETVVQSAQVQLFSEVAASEIRAAVGKRFSRGNIDKKSREPLPARLPEQRQEPAAKRHRGRPRTSDAGNLAREEAFCMKPKHNIKACDTCGHGKAIHARTTTPLAGLRLGTPCNFPACKCRSYMPKQQP